MNILDDLIESDELNFRVVRIPERRTMLRKETHTLLDRTIQTKELKNIACGKIASSCSVGSHCRVITPTVEEPVHMIEKEFKTDFYYWIGDKEKLLLDRKCKGDCM